MGTSASKDLSRKVSDVASPIEVTLSIDFTIEDAILYLRKKNLAERILYFYVVDNNGQLKGVVNTRTLLLRDPHLTLAEVMQPKVICLRQNQTLEKAIEILQSHRLLALPVIDDDKRLIGVIDVGIYLEETVDIASTKRRNDVFQLIGLYLEEGRAPTPWRSYAGRMPWIFCNIVGGILCAIISRWKELVLSQFLLLAMFIPLVLTLSESISMQSMTQSLQSLKTKAVRWHYLLALLFRELQTVLLIGVTCGLIVGSISLFWGDGIWPGVSIGLGIIFSTLITGLIGATIPILLHAKSWDPKVASGPIVLMFADVLTTALYLSLSSWILLR